MKLYLDIDGVLIDHKTNCCANGANQLIEFITSAFDCYWLTTHCHGNASTAIDYLSRYFATDVITKLNCIKPTQWTTLKTEAIDVGTPFIWLDDYPFQSELSVLEQYNALNSVYRVNLRNHNELHNVRSYLE